MSANKVLERVLSIWSDLEESYKTMGNGTSKKDFLLKMIDYKNGTTALDSLKSNLLKNYEGNEILIDGLVRMFDSINLNLDKIILLEEVDDLNELIMMLMSSVIDRSIIKSSGLSDEFFRKLNPFEVHSTNSVSILELLTKINVASDYYSVDDLGTAYNYIASDDEGAIVLRTANLGEFVAKVKSGSALHTKAYSAIQYLLNAYDFGKGLVFLDKNRFTSVGKRLIVEYNNAQANVELLEFKKLDSGDCYIGKHKNQFGEVLVIGLC